MRIAHVLAAQALSTLWVSARARFVASLHANYVINLDFEPPAAAQKSSPDGEAEAARDVKVMSFAGGKRQFRCTLPNRANSTGFSAAETAVAARAKEGDLAKSREHFLKAKLVAVTDTCWKVPKGDWTYDVCFGRKIVGHNAATDRRFSFGQHSPELDELRPGGGVRQMYLGGTGNRTSEVKFVCGAYAGKTRTFSVHEEPENYFVFTVSGPQFCRWREEGGAQARDPKGTPIPVATLLEALRGTCLNVTQGWWTYEYCYPKGLTQFHLHGNSRKRDPEYSLGSWSEAMPTSAMTMVTLKKPSVSPRERRSPPSNHRTLKQRLGNGTKCDETGRPRATSMLFQCPSNWQTKPSTQIVSIHEGSLCEYEVTIHTTLLCGHEKFLPTLPRGKETIQCVADPADGALNVG